MKIPWLFIGRRLLHLVPVLFGVSLFAFAILHLLPGDPAVMVAGEKAPPEVLANIRQEMGLDRPLIEQYRIYLAKILAGDLGLSLVTREPVLVAIAKRLPATGLLALSAITFSAFGGILAGTLCALNRGRFIDLALSSLALLGISMPVFWVALMFILILSLKWGFFPTSTQAVSLEYLILPAITLGMRSAAFITRITRASLLECLPMDHVRTARAKGLGEFSIILKHALYNSMIPIVTVIGLDFASYLNGSVITETIFNWPGVGRYTLQAILERDYPVVQGMVLLGALIFVAINMLVDLVYGLLDPKIRDQYLSGSF